VNYLYPYFSTLAANDVLAGYLLVFLEGEKH